LVENNGHGENDSNGGKKHNQQNQATTLQALA
jgi:hypothetical protein